MWSRPHRDSSLTTPSGATRRKVTSTVRNPLLSRGIRGGSLVYKERVRPPRTAALIVEVVERHKRESAVGEEGVDLVEARQSLVHIGEGDLHEDQVDGAVVDHPLGAFDHIEIES